MFYDTSFLGMGIIWWMIWSIVVFWIFALPYNIPGQRHRRESPLEILHRRLASGEITNEEYLAKKKYLERDLI